jgi:hypothetical protein
MLKSGENREIEELLSRYRPIGPRSELSDQISKFPDSHFSKSTWPWAVAAAALLAITVGLHAAAVVGEGPKGPIDPRPLARQLGDDDLAYSVAQLTLMPSSAANSTRGAIEAPSWFQ